MPQLATLSPSHPELADQLTAIYNRVNAAGVNLRLYVEDEDWNGDKDAATDFVEASFTGYAAIDLESEWSAPAQDFPGVWSISTGEYDFTLTAEPQERVYGAFIESAGDVLFSGRLPFPFLFTLGAPTLRLRVTIFQAAALIHAALVLG